MVELGGPFTQSLSPRVAYLWCERIFLVSLAKSLCKDEFAFVGDGNTHSMSTSLVSGQFEVDL